MQKLNVAITAEAPGTSTSTQNWIVTIDEVKVANAELEGDVLKVTGASEKDAAALTAHWESCGWSIWNIHGVLLGLPAARH